MNQQRERVQEGLHSTTLESDRVRCITYRCRHRNEVNRNSAQAGPQKQVKQLDLLDLAPD